ncbi:HNH endonuclease [Lihuaxuella thermophila]|uniref:HNH endonuclease n=1 Tax=Lihuaxuella thermophila TaxID=1173111 RepID=UPI000B7F05BB|nr:HNH endonuclease [Lihuaxuella thermophila]
MPKRPLRPCNKPGCPNLTQSRYCDKHANEYKTQERQRKREYNRKRPTPAQLGYDREWAKARQRFLKANPYCVVCGDKATVVDHIVPHKGDRYLFWQASNWAPMCWSCHSRKTAKYDSGFANKKIKYTKGN